jgi:transposase
MCRAEKLMSSIRRGFAQLVEHGLVRPSFVPPPAIRQLRDFTRHRRVLSEERTRMVQRLEKVLQDAGIKLTSVASTVLSKSSRAMLEAMLAGESDPVVLADLAKGRMRSKIPALTDALRGSFRVSHHGLLVRQILAHIDFLDHQLAELDEQIITLVADIRELRVEGHEFFGLAQKQTPDGRTRRRGAQDGAAQACAAAHGPALIATRFGV